MPSFTALSTRLSVMPEPGNAMTPLGRRFEQLVVAPERSGPSVCVPVRLAHHLVHAVAFGPLRGDVLDAGSAAVHEDDVVVLRLRLVEAGDDGARVRDVLPARDGDPAFPGAGAPGSRGPSSPA